MSVSREVEVLILPGLGSSGPDHWQSHWERRDASLRRVEQRDWETPHCDDWVRTLDAAVRGSDVPLVLVGHSSACAMVAHWVAQAPRESLAKIAGALLVAPSDPLGPNYPPGPRGFAGVPLAKLPFRTIVVCGDDDPYVTLKQAGEYADAWGADLVILPGAGHINTASGHGEWEEGFALLERLRR